MSENIPVIQSIERKLHEALALTDSKFAPPTLVQALHHAVFPGGARIRPQLCLAVLFVTDSTTFRFSSDI